MRRQSGTANLVCERFPPPAGVNHS